METMRTLASFYKSGDSNAITDLSTACGLYWMAVIPLTASALEAARQESGGLHMGLLIE